MSSPVRSNTSPAIASVVEPEQVQAPAAVSAKAATAVEPTTAPVGHMFPKRDNRRAKVAARSAAVQTRIDAKQKPSLKATFERVMGANAIADLQAHMQQTPVVLIAGDQLTGKSTLAKAVAGALGGSASGTGAIVRKLAQERGVSIEELAKKLALEPETDVRIDYRATDMIARGDATTFESRLAGHLGAFMKKLGRENVVSVYLECAPLERALRYVAREVGPAARQRLEPLVKVPAGADLETCLQAIGATGDPSAALIAANFGQIAGRDESDYRRLKNLYGVDYRDKSAFDVVIDTTGKDIPTIQAEIEAAVAKLTAAKS